MWYISGYGIASWKVCISDSFLGVVYLSIGDSFLGEVNQRIGTSYNWLKGIAS